MSSAVPPYLRYYVSSLRSGNLSIPSDLSTRRSITGAPEYTYSYKLSTYQLKSVHMRILRVLFTPTTESLICLVINIFSQNSSGSDHIFSPSQPFISVDSTTNPRNVSSINFLFRSNCNRKCHILCIPEHPFTRL